MRADDATITSNRALKTWAKWYKCVTSWTPTTGAVTRSIPVTDPLLVSALKVNDGDVNSAGHALPGMGICSEEPF